MYFFIISFNYYIIEIVDMISSRFFHMHMNIVYAYIWFI